MFQVLLKHTGMNKLHEHAVHAKHVHHQFACIGVTPVQSFSLDFSLPESLLYMLYIWARLTW